MIGGSFIPADNGVLIPANYSYKLGNVTMSDAGRYFARVEVPSGQEGQGPNFMLNVAEKPGELCPCACKHVAGVIVIK